MGSPRDTFAGRWRIASMAVWDELDVLGPSIEFDTRNGGMFQFVAVSGDIDYRVSTEGDVGVMTRRLSPRQRVRGAPRVNLCENDGRL
jgi:hypothetical protein